MKGRLNGMSVLETRFKGSLYRADRLSPEEVRAMRGFKRSENFSAIEKMIVDEDVLIVSESLTGALRYVSKQDGTIYYIYKIQSDGLVGASVNENIKSNVNGLGKFLGQNADSGADLDWICMTNGANTLDEAHVRLRDVTYDRIAYVGSTGDDDIKKQVKELKPGKWMNYF